VIVKLRMPRVQQRAHRSAKGAYCEADRWTFDPRYTQGRCPICGWAPEGAPSAPRWLTLANRLDWQMIGLFAFVDVLVLLGLIVASAAGLLPAGHGIIGMPSSPGAASAARLH
jgi:hypothetical protein